MEYKMKVKICRMSGLPVEKSDLENFKVEWKRLYDKASSLAKTDMLRLQKRLATIEKVLDKKYPTVTEVELPTEQDAWNKLMDEFGNIVVTRMKDSSEVVLAVYDIEDGRY